MKHPNALTAAGMTPVALLAYRAAEALGWEMGTDEALILGGGITAVVLFVGRNGLRGLARIVWRGQGIV